MTAGIEAIILTFASFCADTLRFRPILTTLSSSLVVEKRSESPCSKGGQRALFKATDFSSSSLVAENTGSCCTSKEKEQPMWSTGKVHHQQSQLTSHLSTKLFLYFLPATRQTNPFALQYLPFKSLYFELLIV